MFRRDVQVLTGIYTFVFGDMIRRSSTCLDLFPPEFMIIIGTVDI